MGLVTLPYTLTAGTVARASEVMANLTALRDEINGALDGTNLAAGAVTENKIADTAVTNPKIDNGAIDNAKVAVGAAIDATKIGAGLVTNAEFGYLGSVTSDVQAQLNARALTTYVDAQDATKQDTITGAASTVVSADLTASRALVSGVGGKIEASTITSTELGYLAGVTSGIQAQIDGKLASGANAVSASRWQTARQISLGGDLSGSVTFDGSANFTLVGTVLDNSHNHSGADITTGTIAAARLPAASTSVQGAVQLNDTITSTSTTQAATANAVKQVNDKLPGTITVSTSAPSGGSNGDVWIRV